MSVRNRVFYCLLICILLFDIFDANFVFSSTDYLIEFHGFVFDGLTGLPLPNATILVFYYSHGTYSSFSTMSDSSGYFNLSLSFSLRDLPYFRPTFFVGAFCDDFRSPGLDYVPQIREFKLEFTGKRKFIFKCNFRLHPAASIRVFDEFLYVNFSGPADKLRFTVISSNGSVFVFEDSISNYGELDSTSISFLLDFIGISSNEIVVPARVPFNVIVKGMFAESFSVPVTSWWRKRITKSIVYKQVDLLMFDDAIEVEPGSLLNVSILKVTLRASQKVVDCLYNLANIEVEEAGSDGFYVTSVANRLVNVGQLIDQAKRFFEEGKFLPCFSAFREAFLSLDSIISYVKWMRGEVNYSAVSLMFFFSISSLALALMVTENDFLKPLFSALFSLLFLYLLLVSYPKFHFYSSYYFIVLFPSMMLIFLIFLSRFISTKFSITPFSMLFEFFSIAKRNLRRRKIRTLAMLISLVFFTFGSVALTSFSSEIGVMTSEGCNEFKVNGVSFEKMFPTSFIVLGFSDVEAEFNPYGLPPSQKILYTINSTGSVDRITVRAESRAKVRPLGFLLPLHDPLKKLNIYGIIAFSSNVDPVYMRLVNFLVNGSMPIDDDDIAISFKAARLLGVDVGDKVVFKGKGYRVSGLLDDQKLFYAREISGRPLLPYKMFLSLKGEDGHPSIYESEVCFPEEVVFLAWSEVKRLNLLPTRYFAYLNMSDVDLISVARAAALSGGGHAITALTGERSINMVLIEYTEFRGYEAIIPIFLIVFNAAITAQATLHERRREILTFSAIGCSPSRLFLIFLFEAFLIGFSGGAIGYALGLSSYKILPIISSLDVKPKISFVWAVISMLIAIVSMTIGAASILRSSLLIVPSRLWRIKAVKSAEKHEDYWLFEVPVRIKEESAEKFMNFIYRELKSFRSSSEEALNVVSFKHNFIDGKKTITIVFTYDVGAGSASRNTSRGIIELTVVDGECEVYLKVRSYGRDSESHVYKTARLIRNLALKWM